VLRDERESQDFSLDSEMGRLLDFYSFPFWSTMVLLSGADRKRLRKNKKKSGCIRARIQKLLDKREGKNKESRFYPHRLDCYCHRRFNIDKQTWGRTVDDGL